MYKEKVVIENSTLYLGDCLDVMKTLDKADAVITDPPYGIGESNKKNLTRGGMGPSGKKKINPRDCGDYDWDNKPASQEMIKAIIDGGKWKAIFGGNYFHLPPSSCYFKNIINGCFVPLPYFLKSL